eukprot:6196363-Pleurochrysis_carterae.AAC.1
MAREHGCPLCPEARIKAARTRTERQETRESMPRAKGEGKTMRRYWRGKERRWSVERALAEKRGQGGVRVRATAVSVPSRACARPS